MFTKTDVASIEKSYFNTIFAGCFVIVLQSKNTNHFWVLQSGSEYSSVNILHKHNKKDIYHQHGRAKNLTIAIKDIKKHDVFQLNNRSC